MCRAGLRCSELKLAFHVAESDSLEIYQKAAGSRHWPRGWLLHSGHVVQGWHETAPCELELSFVHEIGGGFACLATLPQCVQSLCLLFFFFASRGTRFCLGLFYGKSIRIGVLCRSIW